MEDQSKLSETQNGGSEDEVEIQETIHFIEKVLIELQGFVASENLLCKRGFELFMGNSSFESSPILKE